MEVKITKMEHRVFTPDFWEAGDYWMCEGRCNGKWFDAVFDPTDKRMTIPRGCDLGLTLDEQKEFAAIVRNKFQAAAKGA